MTHYDILEVAPHSSPDVIKNAYRALAKKYHPDLQPNENAKQLSESTFKIITQAYEVLSDIETRKNYDLWLNINNIQKKAIPSDAIFKETETSKAAILKKNGKTVFIALFLIGIITFVVSVANRPTVVIQSVTAQKPAEPYKDLEILGISLEKTTYGRNTVGRVKNNSTSTTYSNFVIECNVYDKDNSILQTVNIVIKDKVPPGEVLKFNGGFIADLAVSVKPIVIRDKRYDDF